MYPYFLTDSFHLLHNLFQNLNIITSNEDKKAIVRCFMFMNIFNLF